MVLNCSLIAVIVVAMPLWSPNLIFVYINGTHDYSKEKGRVKYVFAPYKIGIFKV